MSRLLVRLSSAIMHSAQLCRARCGEMSSCLGGDEDCAEILYIILTLAREASGALSTQLGECPACRVRALSGQ